MLTRGSKHSFKKKTVMFGVSLTIILLMYHRLYKKRKLQVSLYDDHTRWHAQQNLSIGIGAGLTMRGFQDIGQQSMRTQSVFFTQMLPSLCLTLSPGYKYKLYIGHDEDDPVLSTEKKNIFISNYEYTIRHHCQMPLQMSLVRCNHSKSPAWAQNDALMEAYHSGADYLYMVNDDTVFHTAHWTEAFIYYLSKLPHPNVGVVGPTFSQGNTNILTYNFVHRTHVDIFGYFYPREFRDWLADEWISRLYLPKNVVKVPEIAVDHTEDRGIRYEPHTMDCGIFAFVIRQSRTQLQDWILRRGMELGPLGEIVEYDTKADKDRCEWWRKKHKLWAFFRSWWPF